jgi:DnaJ-class molecular chaperone
LVLGTEIEVPTLDGPVSLKVPAGTKAGQEFRLKGKGLPSFNGRETIYQRGDQLVRVELDVPTSLTERHRQLIEELAQLEQGD